MFILTDCDLYPQDNWTFVFGVTRPNLRTLVQSIARHDAKFPEISSFRKLNTIIKRANTLNERKLQEVNEGGNYVSQTVYHKYCYNANSNSDSEGVKPGLYRSNSLQQTTNKEGLTENTEKLLVDEPKMVSPY